MPSSKKRLWLARLLALLIVSLAFSLLVGLVPENRDYYAARVEIRTNGNIGDIVAVVEDLARDDISIKTRETSWLTRNARFPYITMSIFIWAGLFLGFYHAIYCAVNSIFGWTRHHDNFPTSDKDTLPQPYQQAGDPYE